MKEFIVSDDKNLTDRKDDKLILIKLKFSINGCKNLYEKEIFKLSSAAQDFFHLIYSFGKNENIANFVNVWMLENPIQQPVRLVSSSASMTQSNFSSVSLKNSQLLHCEEQFCSFKAEK